MKFELDTDKIGVVRLLTISDQDCTRKNLHLLFKIEYHILNTLDWNLLPILRTIDN